MHELLTFRHGKALDGAFHPWNKRRTHTQLVHPESEEERHHDKVSGHFTANPHPDVVRVRRIRDHLPLTHDLVGHLMTALGARVERVIINDLKNATYYARIIIRAENELQQKKIVELDARPSDCIAMATQQKAPIYVSQEVWDEVDDMTDVLRKMEEEGLKPDPDAEFGSESSEEEE